MTNDGLNEFGLDPLITEVLSKKTNTRHELALATFCNLAGIGEDFVCPSLEALDVVLQGIILDCGVTGDMPTLSISLEDFSLRCRVVPNSKVSKQTTDPDIFISKANLILKMAEASDKVALQDADAFITHLTGMWQYATELTRDELSGLFQGLVLGGDRRSIYVTLQS